MTTPTPTHSINDLREHLMQTLAALRDRENPMDIDRARAIGTVASVLVDTARVETDYLKLAGGASAFMEPTEENPKRLAGKQGAHNPFGASLVHRLGD
jgi:hypothetical protein